jgi:hypothetical protein
MLFHYVTTAIQGFSLTSSSPRNVFFLSVGIALCGHSLIKAHYTYVSPKDRDQLSENNCYLLPVGHFFIRCSSLAYYL